MKIPKVYSEAAHQRWKDNTMTTINITKGQTTIFKTLHLKLKIK